MQGQTMLKYALSLLLLFSFNTNLVYADAALVERKDVQLFIKQMAHKHHFSKQFLTSLLESTHIRPDFLQHINKPLEKESWNTYQLLFVSEWRVKHGVEFWNKYEKELTRAEKIYGVPASIIVATIGIETKYGERMGDYRVIDSLTNLAFSQSPRAKFFRSELEQFLLLTREKHLDPRTVTGSYAGAIGQPQFMPSNYRSYAVNFSGSGKTDLINDEVDVIGSVANYYKQHGWKYQEPIAAPALVVGSHYHQLKEDNKFSQHSPIAYWMRFGIIPKHEIADVKQLTTILELENRFKNEYWFSYHNFDVIKRYNASDLYAMAVFQLSNYIKALKSD